MSPSSIEAIPSAVPVVIGGARLCIEDVVAVARCRRRATLSAEPGFRARIQSGADFLDRLLAEDGVVTRYNPEIGRGCEISAGEYLLEQL